MIAAVVPGHSEADMKIQEPGRAAARIRLAQRLHEINDEIRAYPQPIARCDAQLGGLFEERERIRSELERLDAAPGEA